MYFNGNLKRNKKNDANITKSIRQVFLDKNQV